MSPYKDSNSRSFLTKKKLNLSCNWLYNKNIYEVLTISSSLLFHSLTLSVSFDVLMMKDTFITWQHHFTHQQRWQIEWFELEKWWKFLKKILKEENNEKSLTIKSWQCSIYHDDHNLHLLRAPLQCGNYEFYATSQC